MKQILTLILMVAGLQLLAKEPVSVKLIRKQVNSLVTDTSGLEKITKTKGYEARTTGINFVRIETYMDSTYYPKSMYYNVRFTEVTGLDLSTITRSKLKVELSNQQKENIPLGKEPKFYAAKTFKEGDQINILISIPLNPTDLANKKYNYKLSLQTASGSLFINMTGKLGFK
jgi:hypothetical protein